MIFIASLFLMCLKCVLSIVQYVCVCIYILCMLYVGVLYIHIHVHWIVETQVSFLLRGGELHYDHYAAAAASMELGLLYLDMGQLQEAEKTLESTK